VVRPKQRAFRSVLFRCPGSLPLPLPHHATRPHPHTRKHGAKTVLTLAIDTSPLFVPYAASGTPRGANLCFSQENTCAALPGGL